MRLRLCSRQTVQVDLPLHAILAATQLAQHRRLHLRAMEHQLLAAGELRVGALRFQALLEHRRAISAREARVRGRPGRAGRDSALPQRPDTAHRILEQARIVRVVVRVLIAGQGSHGRLRR